MDANAPTTSKDLEEKLSRIDDKLEEALSRIHHERRPKWWITDGVFDRKKGARAFDHDVDAIAEEATRTGWRPRHPHLDHRESSAPTHIALQQIGVGVGHPMYLHMLNKYHPANITQYSKADFRERYAKHVPDVVVTKARFKDVLCMAMTRDINREFYNDHGDPAMKVKEASDRQEVRAKYEAEKEDEKMRDKEYREGRIPPRRRLPFEKEALEGAKRLKIDQGSYLPAENIAVASGSRPVPAPTGQRGRTIPIGVLEDLVHEMRRKKQQQCDIDEVMSYLTGPSTVSRSDPPNVRGPGAEP